MSAPILRCGHVEPLTGAGCCRSCHDEGLDLDDFGFDGSRRYSLCCEQMRALDLQIAGDWRWPERRPI